MNFTKEYDWQVDYKAYLNVKIDYKLENKNQLPSWFFCLIIYLISNSHLLISESLLKFFDNEIVSLEISINLLSTAT